MKLTKLCMILNIPAPYMVPRIEAIAHHKGISLFVYFAADTRKGRAWNLDIKGKFRYKVLPGMNVVIGNFKYTINLTFLLELLKRKHDIYVIGGWDTAAAQLGFLYAKICRKPVFILSAETANKPSLMKTLSRPVARNMVRYSTGCLALSTLAKDYLIMLGAKQDRVYVLPNSIDTEFFSSESEKYRQNRATYRSKIGIRSRNVILYVGRLIGIKGVEYLLRAYMKIKSEIPDTCLVLVGDGPQRNYLEDICIKENIDGVYFVGNVNNSDLPMYYSIADVFVLPSLRETWGIVLNEAMACKCPVVASRGAGASKDLIVNDYNGLIVNEADVSDLYLAIKKVIQNSSIADRFRENSYDKIMREYSVESFKRAFLSAIGPNFNSKA